jgi:hypothetical protein
MGSGSEGSRLHYRSAPPYDVGLAPTEVLLRSVDKQKKTATELEEIVKQRIGAGDFKVTIHSDPETGWHATIYGRQPAEVHRCQVMADTIVVELSQHYELAD